MKRIQDIVVALVSIMLAITITSHGDIIYETASFAPSPLGQGPDYSVLSAFGSVFHLDDAVDVTAIGANAWGTGTIFGLLIGVGNDGLPPSFPFATNEILALGIAPVTDPSTDVIVPLAITLGPGDYAVIFGTDHYGASGWSGGSPYGVQNASVTNIFSNAGGWSELGLPHRYFVIGTVVPEPSTIVLLASALLGLAVRSQLIWSVEPGG